MQAVQYLLLGMGVISKYDNILGVLNQIQETLFTSEIFTNENIARLS